jgi:hypothetical protein
VHYNSKSKIATWQLFLFEVPYMGKYGLFVADKKAKFWILVSLLSLLVWIIRLIQIVLGASITLFLYLGTIIIVLLSADGCIRLQP